MGYEKGAVLLVILLWFIWAYSAPKTAVGEGLFIAPFNGVVNTPPVSRP